MKMPIFEKTARGQTSLEYLLLLSVVAIVVIASFNNGSLIDQVHNSAQDYYNSVTRVIMGETPKPIVGGWCPVTCPAGAGVGPKIMYRACECPAPAFGGAYCSGSNAVSCSGQSGEPGTAVQCPPNMYFDTTPSTPGYNTCQCIAGTVYTTGPGCVKA